MVSQYPAVRRCTVSDIYRKLPLRRNQFAVMLDYRVFFLRGLMKSLYIFVVLLEWSFLNEHCFAFEEHVLDYKARTAVIPNAALIWQGSRLGFLEDVGFCKVLFWIGDALLMGLKLRLLKYWTIISEALQSCSLIYWRLFSRAPIRKFSNDN